MSPIFERRSRGGDQHLNTAAAVEGGGAETEREARALRAAAGGLASPKGAPWGPFLGVTTDARFRLTVVAVLIQVKCFSSGGRTSQQRQKDTEPERRGREGRGLQARSRSSHSGPAELDYLKSEWASFHGYWHGGRNETVGEGSSSPIFF